jgi:hypothetical protein
MPPKSAPRPSTPARHNYSLRPRPGRRPSPTPTPASSHPVPTPVQPPSGGNLLGGDSDPDPSTPDGGDGDETSDPTPSPTPSPQGLFNPNCRPQGGISDTPPERIIPRTGEPQDTYEREYHNQSVSRQLYIWRTLSSLRSAPWYNLLCTLSAMVVWRSIVYPVRMYARPTAFCVLVAWVGGITYLGFSVQSWESLFATQTSESFLPSMEYAGMAIWLLLHLWDMFRGIEYVVGNPRFQAGWRSGWVVRLLAILRPFAPLVMLTFSVLARVSGNMDREAYLQVLLAIFNESLLLCWACGACEVLVYWVVGTCEIVLNPAAARGGFNPDGQPAQPLMRVQRWEVDGVLPWSTVLAWFYAAAYFNGYVVKSLERRSWIGAHESAYRGARSAIEGVFVPMRMTLRGRDTGNAM